MLGGAGDDTLDGVDGRRDSMYGEDGDDDIFGDFSEDVFSGGNGWDRFFDEFDVEF
jgi:hypothetical protein